MTKEIMKTKGDTSRLLWDQRDFLAKFRSGIRLEFTQTRLTIIWSQPQRQP